MAERPLGLKSLLTGSAKVGLFQAVGVIVGYVATVAAARILGGAAFGEYSFAWNFGMLLANLVALGLPVFALREVSVSLASDDPGRARSIAGFASAVPLTAGGVVAVALGVAAALVGGESLGLLATGALAAPGLGLILVTRNILKARRLALYSHVAQSLLIPACLLVATVAMSSSGVKAVLAALAGLTLFVAVGQTLVLTGRSRGGAVSLQGWAPRDWFRQSLPLSAVVIARVAQNQADVLILGLLLAPDVIGSFAASKRTALLVGSLLVASNDLVVPEIARRFSRGDMGGLRAITTRTTRAVAGVAVIATCTVGLAGPVVLGVFDSSFAADGGLLWILLAGQLANVAFGPSSAVLAMTGHQRILAQTMVVTSVVSVVVLILLSSVYGATGAAVGSALSIALWNVAARAQARRHIGVDTSILGRHSYSS